MNPLQLRVFFLLPLLINTSCSTNNSKSVQSEEIFELIEGSWGHNSGHTCKENPHTISVSDDRKLLLFKHNDDVTSYDGEEQDFYIYHILDYGSSWLAVGLNGEKRKFPNGEPVVWRIYLNDDQDRYTWWRYDWPKMVRAKRFGIRCEKEDLKTQ